MTTVKFTKENTYIGWLLANVNSVSSYKKFKDEGLDNIKETGATFVEYTSQKVEPIDNYCFKSPEPKLIQA